MDSDQAPYVPLDVQRLTNAMRTSSPSVDWSIRVVDSTGSTNADLAALAASGAPSGTVLIAEEQTAGRGRLGRAWQSHPGSGIWMSVLLRPAESLSWSWLPLLTGVATVTALRSVGVPADLKWPNDVLSGEQKICGILVEQHSHGNRQGVLVGIGVNVNNSLSGAPAEVAQRATSLFDLEGKSFDLTAILIEILQRLDFRISQLTTHPRLALSEANRHNILTGRTVTLQLADQTVTGVCIGIDDEGQLVLQTEEKLLRCYSGLVLQW